jgi:AcrR family transcriptional regulator
MSAREPLSPARIIDAAVQVADDRGLGGVSMRTVGAQLGVEAMSLYHHVANKQALLDGLSSWVFDRMGVPPVGEPWRDAMSVHARSMRSVLVRHPWALTLMNSQRAPALGELAQYDAVLGILRGAGFGTRLAAHAVSVIDAYVYGFALTERNLPVEPGADVTDLARDIAPPADLFPHLAELVEFMMAADGYVYADEFEYGLEVVLDGIERRLREPD